FMLCALGDFHHPSWIENNKEFRKQRIEYTKNCINLAMALNVKTVSTEPGGPIEKMSEKEALDIFEEGINQILPLAEKNNVKLLIEPEPDLLIGNSSQFLNFISRFKTRYLGLNFDIGHFFCVNENPSIVMKELKDYVGHIHLEDIAQSKIHKHLIPGTGSIDFESIFNTISEINYKGYVTVELYPYLENPEHAAKTALSYLQSLNL
ncbi:MAG: sugar phosphate isomerase/epimerase, partial [Nitrosarchaeum sp.]|nr:sugar phosphate isomerase/epimerase [Nitrosarchaeum sp.]